MKIKSDRNLRTTEFGYPIPIYFFVKFLNSFRTSGELLNTIENSVLAEELYECTVESPVYITGFARAGSTILLEMLDSHRLFTSHRYFQIGSPSTPYFMNQFIEKVPLMTEFSERVHNDRILVNRDSPEGLEEIYWQNHFPTILDENESDILDESVSNNEFEKFYRNQMKKLIISQEGKRYVAKNNYVITRIDYVRKIFLDSRFIVMVRNPVNHIASLIKQDMLIGRLERQDPRIADWEKMVGHREFGIGKKVINVGNDVAKIRSLWKKKDTYVRGWARYWGNMYEYIYQKSKETKDLLLVRYEDLCDKSAATIDRIFDYLSVDDYAAVKKKYANILERPKYYSISFSEEEMQYIIDEAGPTARKYGYDIDG
ncbi:MAG: sulfotransferase [Promethearchaeia archaeon]